MFITFASAIVEKNLSFLAMNYRTTIILAVRPPRLRLHFVSVGKARRPLFGIGLLEPVHVLLADPEFGGGLSCFQLLRNRKVSRKKTLAKRLFQ